LYGVAHNVTLNFSSFVIPAQAGIQRFYSTCFWVLSRDAGNFIAYLDSGLRRNDEKEDLER